MNTPIDTTPTLPGYRLTEQLYNGQKTLVYRGIRVTDSAQQAVVIKLLQREYPNFSELLQFRNQYTIAKNLNIPGLIQPYSLEPYRNSYALVMEDFGGLSLRNYIQHYPLLLTELLEIAIQLTQILHGLYQNRVIHKDIKPANILIHPETKQIKLIDFSIASLLPKETEEVKPPNVLEGTLAYIAPEQTGRMNRGIDYRTDFYAFGVTLFELLTGQLPYQSNDLMELVHCHIAKPAPLVSDINPEIPQVIAQIVAKLMAKNAENRYQSALGLKYDLEKCLDRVRKTGQIKNFKIASKDISDRFIIPEKLYGRENEVKTLLEAFERVGSGTSEMLLVAGFSGIGKTAIVNEVHKPIVQQRGYFIKGKFDQFNRNIPLAAFVQAFRDLMGQLLSESDAQLQTWKAQILKALGENGQVIIEVIPELEQIIEQQPPAAELAGSAAQNRFNLLFKNFIRVFTKPEHPLVMFLDDLQWADSASLNLMQLLMAESETGYLLLIGAYRDNEVFAAHPLMLTLDGVIKAGATVNTMTLQSLSQSSLNHLVADTLNCAEVLAQPLTELTAQKTQGNPFFATQFLKALHQDKLIVFDLKAGHWQCDIAGVREAALTDDVVEFMALQLQKLPEITQDVLKLAACIGNQFDLATLAIVSEKSETEAATALWKALQEGLILPQSEVYKFYLEDTDLVPAVNHETLSYKFLHDRIQQAAYSQIFNDQKQATHLYIGRLLLAKLLLPEKEERIFEIVNHLNIGSPLIIQASQKEELARLNLLAGTKAKASTAYAGALTYITGGIELLPPDCWECHYDLSLSLFKERAELEYLNGNFERAECWLKQAVNQAKAPLEKAEIYNMAIVQYTLQAKYLEAIEAGRQALALVNIDLPEENLDAVRDTELAIVQKTLKDRPFSELASLPMMTQAEQKMAIKLLISMGPPTYRSHQKLWSVICSKAVNLCLQHGNTPEIGYIYPAFGGLRGYALNNYQGTGELLDVTLQLMQAFNNKSAESVAYLMIGSSLRHWSHPLHIATEDYISSYRVGLESSNLQYAAYAFGHNMYCRFYQSIRLEYLFDEIAESLAFSRKYKNQWAIDLFSGGQKIVAEFMGTTVELSESNYLEQCRQHKNWQVICIYNILKTQLLLFLERVEEAFYYGEQAEAEIINVAPQGLLPYAHHCFIYALLLIARYRALPDLEKSICWDKIFNYQKQLEIWAKNNPVNFLHLYCLVKAEIHQLSGNDLEAIENYDRAITSAKENNFIQEEAFANELAAKFYLNWGKEKVAAGYMQEAYYCYAKWGAKAKTDDLEKRYPQLLQPILQQAAQPLTILETLASITTTTHSIHSTHTRSSSTTSLNKTLDFAALLKVSQAISSTIQLDELIQTLTQTMLENSGADRCALMLCQDNEWQVRAISDLEQTTLQVASLEHNSTVPVRLIQYVKNTLELIVIDNLKTDLPVVGNYLNLYQPKSVLCLPILNQGNLVGILYLENRVTTGVFTSERLLVLNFLSIQAAISINNARLYTLLHQNKTQLQNLANNLPGVIYKFCMNVRGDASFPFISNRSRDLFEVEPDEVKHSADPIVSQIDATDLRSFKSAVSSSMQTLQPFTWVGRFHLNSGQQKWIEANSTPELQADGSVIWDGVMLDVSDRKLAEQELQQAQLQIVQSEKMSALGNLVAGVAHEINNPIGCIVGNVDAAQDYINDLLDVIDLYAEKFPQPGSEIENELETIDLDYVRSDLPKLIRAMKDGGDRITSISKSLRTFSRADSDTKQLFNLHDGIDSTVLILRHRLKPNEHRPAIEVVTDYGKIPEIACYAGQLNQVFMNLLANAIDALDESNTGRSFDEIKANPNRITITTSAENNLVKIAIADNGKGMPSEVKTRIFDHLFTTKGVGKGTGLGLAIARQIVVEKHGGAIEVKSPLGKGTEFVLILPMSEQ